MTQIIRLFLLVLVGFGALHAFENLGLAERVVGSLGALVDALNHIIRRRNAAPVKPIEDIRLSTHGSDINHLLQAEYM